MYQRILVALDETPRAVRVLDVACEVAERFDAELFLLRVVEGEQDLRDGERDAESGSHRFLERKAFASLQQLALGRARTLKTVPIVAFGSPVASILRTAQRSRTDLIVVGSHGYHGLDRLLVTDAAGIANLASNHVLVVHEP